MADDVSEPEVVDGVVVREAAPIERRAATPVAVQAAAVAGASIVAGATAVVLAKGVARAARAPRRTIGAGSRTTTPSTTTRSHTSTAIDRETKQRRQRARGSRCRTGHGATTDPPLGSWGGKVEWQPMRELDQLPNLAVPRHRPDLEARCPPP
jgi:hypothetical protein